MNIALLRAAFLSGLLLVALSAISPPAGAATPAGAWPVPGLGSPATVRADPGGTSIASVSEVQCPCNAGLPQGNVASILSSATYSDPIRSGGFQPGVAPTRAIESSGTFDWADASIGAGVTAVIGLLFAGGALMFGRRRVREQLRTS